MKIILISIMFCLISSISYAKKTETHNIVVLFDKSYANQNCEVLSRELNKYLSDPKYNITRIFMNCDSQCSENKMDQKIKKALVRVENKSPELLIIASQTTFILYNKEIMEFRDRLGIRVGLFNFLKDSDYFEQLFNEEHKGYFVSFSEINFSTFMYYIKRNGVEFNNYYILRDEDGYSLRIANYIKVLLLKYSKFNIEIKTVTSLQSLKNTILDLQLKPQGIIIPIIKQIRDTELKDEIMSIISSHNRKHFELGIFEDSTKYLCFSLAHVPFNEYQSYKKYPDNKHIDDLNLEILLAERINKSENVFGREELFFIMNERRVSDIMGGYKLLKFKNDFIDFLR